MVKKNRVISILFLVCFSMLIFGLAVPAKAEINWGPGWSWPTYNNWYNYDYDTLTGSWNWNNYNQWSGIYGNLTFTTFSPYSIIYNQPSSWITFTVGNNTLSTWDAFYIRIFPINGYDIGNVSLGRGIFWINLPSPSDTPIPITWDPPPCGGPPDFICLLGSPLATDNSGTFKVYFNNPDNVEFGVSFYPAPEPISSILFLTGGAVLGGRSFLKKRKKGSV